MVRSFIHSCCYHWECWGPVVLSCVNKVPHHLLQGANPQLNLAVSLMVLLGGNLDFYVKGLHDLGAKLRGKARVLVQNNTQGKTMDIEDSLFEFIRDFLGDGCMFKWNEISVQDKSVHDDYDNCVSIGFIEGDSEVYGERLVPFVR